LRDHFSDSDYIEIRWVPRFLIFCFVGILITAVAYAIYPRTDTWLIPIANMAGMAYLVYCVLKYSTTAYINRIGSQATTQPQAPSNSPEAPEGDKGGELSSPFGGVRGGSLGEAYMKEVCDKVMNYLAASGAYTNPDLSLPILSVDTGISTKNISRSINGYLKKNFFQLINEMRLEEAKKRLRALGKNVTIDSVGLECGFRSKSSFYNAFRKAEGKTPQKWMKMG